MPIIVKLNGGLGNQLFQYAAGFSLSKLNNVPLLMDTTAYEGVGSEINILRSLGINNFKISASVANKHEIVKIKYPYSFFSKISRYIRRYLLRQFFIDWHPEILKIRSKNYYLEGYFQSLKYFENCEDLIKEFEFCKTVKSSVVNYCEEIKASPISVSIHVRRGDYISNRKVRSQYLVCSDRYFESSIDYFENKYGKKNVKFFLFSDEPKWLLRLCKKPNRKIISGHENIKNKVISDVEELYLMSCCDHQIISNSSFSWWGAFLNKSVTKEIIMPNKWTNYKNLHKNIYPEGWLRFDV